MEALKAPESTNVDDRRGGNEMLNWLIAHIITPPMNAYEGLRNHPFTRPDEVIPSESYTSKLSADAGFGSVNDPFSMWAQRNEDLMDHIGYIKRAEPK